AERLAILRVVPHLHDQLAAVPDVLDRMRQIVDQPRRDASEHRLAFLLSNVLLELDEPVRHGIERVAQLADLVVAAQRDARVELALGDRPRDARQREDATDERAAPEKAE